MCPGELLGEVEDANDLVSVICFEFLLWDLLRRMSALWPDQHEDETCLGIEFDWIRDIANHLGARELLLQSPVLGDLKDANLACPVF